MTGTVEDVNETVKEGSLSERTISGNFDPKRQCSVCKAAFKIGDRVCANKSGRWHVKCSKEKAPEFVGVFLEKDHKPSSIDRDRIKRRLKQMGRKVKSKKLKRV